MAAVALAVACRSEDKQQAVPKVVVLPRPPREVIADLVVPSPATLWQNAQGLAGGMLALLPRGPELAVGAALGLPPLVATRFDLRSPAAGVVVLTDQPALVLAVRVASGAELSQDLTTGAAARHRLEREGEVSVLVPLATPAASAFAFGVLDDAVLIGPRKQLAAVGPYLVRTLLAKAPSEGHTTLSASGAALRELVVPALRARWQRQRAELLAAAEQERAARGRPADFADPDALLAGVDAVYDSLFALASSLKKARAELTLSEAQAELGLTLEPDAAGPARDALALLNPGQAKLGVSLPLETALLVYWSGSRSGAGASLHALGKLFGERLKPDDERALGEVATSLDTGLGSAQAFGLLPDLRLVWRADVGDAERARQGVQGLFQLLERKAVAAPLTAWLGRPSLARSPLRVPGLEQPAQRVELRMAPTAGRAAKPPARVAIATTVDEKRALGAFAYREEPPLSRLVEAERGARSLADEPATAALLTRSEVKALVWADLGKLGLSASPAPASVALSNEADAIAVDFVASQGAVRAALALGLNR